MPRSAAAPRRLATALAAAALALVSLAAGVVAAQDTTTPPLIPRAALFAPAVRVQPQLSPDGARLAWIAPDEGVQRIWLRTLGEDGERVISAEDARDVRRFVWQGDSRHVLYLREIDGGWHLAQTDIETGETRDLTPFGPVITQLVGISATRPNEALVGLNRRDPRLTDVYRIDLSTGAVSLDVPNPGDVSGWFADDELQVRAATALIEGGTMELRARDGEKWRAIRRDGPDETAGGILAFEPGGSRAWVISSAGASAARLLRVDLRRGRSEPVLQDMRFNANDILRHPSKHTLQAVLVVRDRREWELVDRSLRRDFERLRAAADGELSIVSRDLADRRWVVAYEPADGPTSYRLYERSSGQVVPLFVDRPALEHFTLAPMRVVSVPVRRGLEVTAYLTAPTARPAGGLPTVIVAHDGPQSRYAYGWSAEAQWLANRGYAVLQVNYRGSSGYGKAFRDAGSRDAMLADLVAAKEWAIREGVAHPGKICVAGGGYGGFATLAALAFTPNEFSCGVAAFGESGIASYTAATPAPKRVSPAVYSPSARRVSDLAPLSSPLRRGGRIGAPLLVLQGMSDDESRRDANDEAVSALRRQGATVEYYVYAGGNRVAPLVDGNLDALAAAEAFLAKYLGGRAEPSAGATALAPPR